MTPSPCTTANPRLADALSRALEKTIDAWFGRHFDSRRIEAWHIDIEPGETGWLKDAYLRPTLLLLIHYIRSHDDNYLSVYLDERLRYAPHRASAAERARFFQELIPQDEAGLLEALGRDSDLADELRQRLQHIHRALVEVPGEPCMEVLAVGDCIMNEIRVFFTRQCAEAGFRADLRCMYFSAAADRELSTAQLSQYLARNQVDALAFSFLSFSGLPSYSLLLRECEKLADPEIRKRIESLSQLIREFLLELRAETQAPFLIHNSGGVPLTRYRRLIPFLPTLSRKRKFVRSEINAAIADLVRNVPNCVLIDESALVEQFGARPLSKDVIAKKVRGNGMFHTSSYGARLAAAYSSPLQALARLGKKKLLLVDFDNTLWQGVMADGEVTQYHDRQKILLQLKEAGILLVSLSKNSAANIRWDEMTLKQEDFALHKISWNLKAQSVQEVAEELNLGADSFVLIDDNPAERELVRQSAPKVLALDADDPATWRDLALMLQFPNTQLTDEARNRTALYRAQAERQSSLKSNLDYPKMMASLGLSMTFRAPQEKDADRLFELINRTNQFNTTTLRLSKSEILRLIGSTEEIVFVTELRDKFGAMGLVGALILKREADNGALIRLFIMSCRAMGFALEQQMLYEAMIHTASGFEHFIGRYVPTDRNAPCADVFDKCSFTRRSDTDWIYRKGEGQALQSVPWIKVENLVVKP